MSRLVLRTFLQQLRQFRGAVGDGGLCDAELLSRFVANNDQAAFELLVWRHAGMVLHLCRRLLRHEQDAEDAFQATFLTLARKAGAIRRREALAGWLYKIAYRVCLYARGQTLRRSHQALDEAQVPDAGRSTPVDPDFWSVVDEEVERLPSRYREPFVLCCLEGKSDREAADELGCPKGTVLSRLSRARARLRTRLAKRGLTLGGVVVAIAGEQSLAATAAPDLVARTVQAALGAAGKAAAVAASAQVAALSEGVIRVMLWSKVKTLAAAAAVIAILGGGLGALGLGLAGQAAKEQGAPVARSPALPPAPAQEAKAADKTIEDAVTLVGRLGVSQNNLKQIALALHNYHDTYTLFPPPSIYGKDGKPLLSWRVAILPFMEQDHLYKQFHLDEPWDSEHNKKLLEIVPRTYVPVRNAPKEPGMTYYQAVVGKGAAWEPPNGLRIASFTDGLSQTVLVAEAAKAVPWTKPEDLPYAADKPLPRFGGMFDGDFNAAFGDGSVRLLAKDADAEHLRAALTRDLGDIFDSKKIEVANRGGIKLGGKIALKDVEEVNARLARELEQLRAEAEKTKQDIEQLRSEAERAARLLENTVKLQSDVEQARQQLEELKQMKEELKKHIKDKKE
jgi:RNA polymerase sigma factor (sigma-70 family)